MKKLVGPLALVIILAILAIGAVIAVELYEPQYATAVRAANDHSQHDALDILASERVAYYTKILALFTGGLAAFAIIQVGFLIRADNAAAKAASRSERAMIASQRAYIGVGGYKALYEQDKAGQWVYRFRPVWTNSGDTPPRNLRIITQCELRNSKLPANYGFAFDQAKMGSGIINPRDSSLGGPSPEYPSPGVSVQDIKDVQSDNKYLFLWGRAEYDDTFPGERKYLTHFCFLLLYGGEGNPGDDGGAEFNWAYVQTDQGNYTEG